MADLKKWSEDSSKRHKEVQEKLPWDTDDKTDEEESWADVDALLIAYVVRAVGGAGGSAQFTVSNDGGALGIRIYHDDHKTKTTWWRVGDGLEEAMFKVGDYFREQTGKKAQRWE